MPAIDATEFYDIVRRVAAEIKRARLARLDAQRGDLGMASSGSVGDAFPYPSSSPDCLAMPVDDLTDHDAPMSEAPMAHMELLGHELHDDPSAGPSVPMDVNETIPQHHGALPLSSLAVDGEVLSHALQNCSDDVFRAASLLQGASSLPYPESIAGAAAGLQHADRVVVSTEMQERVEDAMFNEVLRHIATRAAHYENKNASEDVVPVTHTDALTPSAWLLAGLAGFARDYSFAELGEAVSLPALTKRLSVARNAAMAGTAQGAGDKAREVPFSTSEMVALQPLLSSIGAPSEISMTSTDPAEDFYLLRYGSVLPRDVASAR